MLALIILFHFIVFLICAIVAWLVFIFDIRRYKQQFNFAGRRRKFIDFLLQRQLVEDQIREEVKEDVS